MNEIKRSTQNRENNPSRSVFWGTLTLDIIAMLVFGYFLVFLQSVDKTPVVYVGMAIFLATFLAALSSLILTIRGWQRWGAEIVLYSLSALGITMVAVFQGRTLTASFSILAISIVTILYLLPSQSRRWYFSVLAASTIAMWVIEWINPAWRIQLGAAKVGPSAAIVFIAIFLLLLFFQTRKAVANRFLSLSLRAKLLVSIISITGVALLIYGGIFLYRTQQSQTFWANELKTNVQEQSQRQIQDTVQFQAHTADQYFSKITLAVQQLADYQANLFASQSLLGQGEYWDGNSRLNQLSGGQYGNAATDLASIFIPNTTDLSPTVIADLNTSMFLDFSAPKVLEEDPNIVAVYYDNAVNYTVYYPNIGLSDLVPPDFDPSAQSFFTVATPQNDPERTPVWTDPYQDQAGRGLIVTNSIPVYDQNNQFRGVMSADIQLSKITEQLSTIKLGQSGFAFLLDPDGHIIAMPDAGYKLFGLQPEVVPVGESPKTTLVGVGTADFQSTIQKMMNGGQGLATAILQDTPYYIAYYPLSTIGYSIGLIVPTAELDAAYLAARDQIDQQTQSTIILSAVILLVMLLVVGGVSLLLGQFLATPLTRLTETATEVSKGNLNVRAEVQTSDEIGTLATAFNTMTNRLREMIGTLEQRVVERTRNLELAAEVGRAVSQVRALHTMLTEAAELIRSQFDLYYVQVYLTDPSQTNLILEAGTGTVGAELLGRGHKLPLNAVSINGRAAVEKRSVVIANTATNKTFRPNALLPETRGEMAIPLMVGERVVGVLDMQTRYPDTLTENLLPAFEALAGQLAIAIQNANLLAETEQARAEVEKQAQRLVRTSWAEYLDAVHKPEQAGFIFEGNQIKPLPLTQTEEVQPHEGDEAITVPIAVTGESVGQLAVELDEQQRTSKNKDLVQAVARQVAQQIESLRLLDTAERYRLETEQAARRLTREGWKTYTNKAGHSLGYVYDLKEVRPVDGEAPSENTTAVPLRVHDETIGKLAIQGIDQNNQEALELANTVAERLGAHIETLRLFDQTQSALAQSEKLFEASRRLTESVDLQELVTGVVESLNIPVVNRALLAVFDYGANNEFVSMTAVANWWNGNGTEATPIGTRYPIEVFKTVSLFSSTTPIFFNDAFNDTRVDAATMALAKRINLRAVAVLPLFSGTHQVGVFMLEAEQPHSFTPEETRLFAALAPQITTVLENRRQYERAQEQAKREAMLNVISQKIQSATTVDAVLQIAARELGHALGASMTVAQLSLKDKS